ncbi:hypothetical protein LZ554_006110 [Drepanopeziza brunnea f. sp. 'monogermtubi']|nr:hypothetical protein LZ554_006110 [Drepanopeziza brunnea f. sp. 'monogermtubi']
MQLISLYCAFFAAASVAALPLNIVLGAYSPAVVVGDGEISFGGAEGGAEAEKLMNTLAGASVGGEGAAEAAKKSSEATPTEQVPPAVKPVPEGEKSDEVNAVEAESEENATVQKRDMAGFTAALNFASGALKTSPGVELGTGEGGSGVGVIVKPGVDAGASPATKPAGEKRNESG